MLVDPGVVLQKIVEDTGGLQPSYRVRPKVFIKPKEKINCR